MNSDVYTRGQHDAYQDRCENAPFASVGGLEKRTAMVAPKYINPGDTTRYLAGYRAACEEMFGADWLTCEFGWQSAIVLNAKHGMKLVPIPDYGEHMSLGVFIHCCETGGFVDYDGTGFLATATEMSNIDISPSHATHIPNFTKGISAKWTHVVWFNK